MMGNIVIRRGHTFSVIRNIEDVEIPYNCTDCGLRDHMSIFTIAALDLIECGKCNGEMVIDSRQPSTKG